MRYFPSTIELLLNFKTSGDVQICDELIIKALYLYEKIDYDVLFQYFCSGTKNRRKFVKIIEKRIKDVFVWKMYDQDGSYVGESVDKVDGVLCFLEPKDTIDIQTFKEYKQMKILKEKKIKEYVKMMKKLKNKNHKMVEAKEKMNISQNSQIEEIKSSLDSESNVMDKRKISIQQNKDIKITKKQKITKEYQNAFMKFIQIEKNEKKLQNTTNEIFYPISYPPDTILYDRNKIYTNHTYRKVEEIQQPQKLTFIQHFDRIRPPFLRVREKTYHRNSLKAFNHIDYDYDSEEEWIVEEGEDIVSEEESTYSEDEESWIEPDSEEIEKKVIKKPTITLNTKCNFIQFKDLNTIIQNLLNRKNNLSEGIEIDKQESNNK